MSIEAMKLALEALTYCEALNRDVERQKIEAITALRQAIEQAQKQQEPLCTAAMFDDAFLAKSGLSPDTKLYTSPLQQKQEPDDLHIAYMSGLNRGKELAQRQWVGLMDEEIFNMGLSNYVQVIREAEAKLRSKNT